MREAALAKTTDGAEVIADRYRVEETLGQGGMAMVYRVTDIATKKNLALKKLLKIKEREKKQQIVEFFEHEYYTLAQLAHPRVIEVFDFGIVDDEPYYTMELLDGGDLRELSPIGWQKACSYMRDICSALSLLHSRRLVHRDITPRNVRCTKDANAKLMDFGAMVPMGSSKQAIGTPAFTAPEVVAMQPLDAQTDLFSLGATLYFALTGRNAYAARNFNELRNVWRREPCRPSEFVETIPRELDELVMALISLDPPVRPISAGEVIERLNAIASLEVDEQLLVSQAYLLKPALVGRNEQLAKFKKMLIRATQGAGTTTVVESASGAGRSRFLDAGVLEAKLAGAVVLRADATDAQAGGWGVVKTLSSQLLAELPELALDAAKPYLPVLGHVLPELVTEFEDHAASSSTLVSTKTAKEEPGAESVREGDDSLPQHDSDSRSEGEKRSNTQLRVKLEVFDDPQQLRPRVHEALREWLFKVSERRCLVLSIDDFDRIDEPSAAFIALFGNQIAGKMAMVIATSDIAAPESSASKVLKEIAVGFKLRNLSLENIVALLASLFGDLPQVRLLANRLFNIYKGNPKAVMQVAQHLVDKGVIRYQAGSWILPDKIEDGEIPSDLADTLKAQIDKLSPEALKLGQALALSPKQSFSIDDCASLLGATDRARLVEVLNDLQATDIVMTDGLNYAIGQPGWISVLTQGIDEARQREHHRNIAQVLLDRDRFACEAARHLFEAGQQQEALDVLLRDARHNKEKIDKSAAAYAQFVISLPEDWLVIYQKALDVCRRLDRPRRETFLLQLIITRIGDLMGIENAALVIEVVEQLVHDSGLKIYHELGDSVEPQQRLAKALELTQQKYDSCPEHKRVLPPAEAIPDLARTISNVIGIAANAYDYELLDAMPSLEPLVPLSPALGIINKSVRSTKWSNAGYFERCARGLREVVDRIAQPDRGGLDDTVHKYIDLGHRWGLGLLEATFGIKSSIKWLDAIEKEPLHQVNAWCLRTVYYLRQGDIEEAEKCKKKIELLHLRNSPTQFYEGTYQFGELAVYMLADDLIRVKRIIPGLQTKAERFATWKPILHIAKGEYQRIRGDYRAALAEFKTALGLTIPGRHLAWPNAVGTCIRALFELNRLQEAKALGEKSLRLAEEMGLEYAATSIQLPFSLVQAALGERESAVRNCQRAIDIFLGLGATGVTLGAAYETRAYVAILMRDEESFEIYSKKCAEFYQGSNYPALAAKYDKLMQRARKAELGDFTQMSQMDDGIEDNAQNKFTEMLSSILMDCQGQNERVQRSLRFIVSESNSTGGYLYVMRDDGPTLCAFEGSSPPTAEMDSVVRLYIQTETGDADVTVTVADLKEPTRTHFEWPEYGEQKYRPVIVGHNTEEGFAITGLAVLCVNPNRGFNLPVGAIVALSRSLLESGDAATVYAI